MQMLAIFFTYFFLLGIIIGSFLNVIILRHNTGRTARGRSGCMTCGHQLTWKELFPVLSFLFQKGRCAHCKTKISWQYPLVELATGVIFAANFYCLFERSLSLPEFFFSIGLTSCIWALMIVIFVYDLRHKIIPDIFSFSAFGLSVIWVFLMTFVFNNNQFVVGSSYPYLQLAGGLIFYIVIYLLWKISDGRLIGLGDAKLLLSIGTILGLVYGLSSIFLSVWIGSAYAIFILLKQRLSARGKHITMKTEIPFGPFLIIGFIIVYFSKIDVTNVSFILENF